MSKPVSIERNIHYVEEGDYYIVRTKVAGVAKYVGQIETLAEAQRIKREWLSERNAAKCQRPVNSEVARGWGYA